MRTFLAGLIVINLWCLVPASFAQDAKPRSLSSYKKIYVEAMPDGMNEYIVAELVKWGKIQIVTEREKADAILTAGMEGKVREVQSSGSELVPQETKSKEEERKGGRSKQSLTDIHTGAVRLIDPSNGVVVWATSKSDFWRWWSGGTRTVAQKLSKQFRKDYEASMRKNP